MNLKRQKKLLTLVLILSILSIVSALVLYALRQNISLFYSPSQIAMGEAPLNHPIRVGGMVVSGSILRSSKDLSVRFEITDYQHKLVVRYLGILPDLFREGQGIVAEGQLFDNQQFTANQILAKHDEKYMPPEVRDALAKSMKSKVKSSV